MTHRKPHSAYPIKPLAVNNNITIPTFQGRLDGQMQPLVNARDLHAFLNIGRDFTTWVKSRIRDYGFAENSDFTCSPVSGSGKNQGFSKFFGGHNRIDYYISLDMAKELAMVERNDKGRLARRYFIDVEKRAVAKAQQALTSQQSWLIEDLQAAYLTAHPQYAKLVRYYQTGLLNNVEIGKLLGLTASTVRYHLQKLNRLQLIQYPHPGDFTATSDGQQVLPLQAGGSHA